MKRRAFTLVEVLISIGIALVLIIAISQIFAIAQQTSGTGTAVLESADTNRAIQSTLVADMRTMANTASDPLVIVSQPIAAFRSPDDMQQDRDGDPRTFNDTNSSASLSTTDPTAQVWAVNSRIHRVDRLCFCARDIYRRQTANAPDFTSGTQSGEAYIWLGHLALPNNTTLGTFDPSNGPQMPAPQGSGFINPGVPSPGNSNNQFASQWILGREVILLQARVPGGPPGISAAKEMAYGGPSQLSPVALLQGNLGSAIVPAGISADGFGVYSSRYDEALTTIQGIDSSIGQIPLWWAMMSGLRPLTFFDVRYYANPFPQKPTAAGNPPAQWMSAAVAQTYPIFVRGCTQFIVEYAGNFVTQDLNAAPNNNNFGRVISLQPDSITGKIDFIPVKDANGNWTRRIRWYGYPRDSQGTGTPDVIPLSLFEANNNATAAQKANWSFERTTTIPSNKWTPPSSSSSPYHGDPYVCAWGADTIGVPRPKMIRITIAIDDPSGRLNAEQTYEYVFTLP